MTDDNHPSGDPTPLRADIGGEIHEMLGGVGGDVRGPQPSPAAASCIAPRSQMIAGSFER
jgi:hypothetical protein